MLSVRHILAALVFCGSVLNAVPANADAEHTVLVLPPKTSGVSPSDAKFLLNIITSAIAHRPNYDVVDSKKVDSALEIHLDLTPGCLKDPVCTSAIADELHADLFVQASFAKGAGKFLLESWLYRTDKSSLVARHAESMVEVSSLKMNAETCVRELFHSFETGKAPPPEPSAAKPAAAPKPPPEQEPVEAPAPPRQIRKPLVASAAESATEPLEPEAPFDVPKRKPRAEPKPPPPDEEEPATPPPRRAPPPAPVAVKPLPKPAPAPAKPAAKPVVKTRILVLDAEAAKGLGKEADHLTEMVADLISAKPGYIVVSDEETQKAERKRLKKNPKCLREKACQHSVGMDVKADILISTKLSKARKKFVLDMNLAIVGDSRSAIHHTETMHAIKNLQMNAELCVKALFK